MAPHPLATALSIGLLAGLIPVGPAPALAAPGVSSSLPRIQAHRGGVPPNTLSGIAASIATGADELEADLRRTSDGVVVLHHDEKLSATCTVAPGRTVQSLTWAVLANVRCSGEPVPRLVDALSLVAPHPQTLMLDVKAYSGQSASNLAAFTKQAVAQVTNAGLVSRTTMSSSSWTVVAPAAHAQAATIKVAAGETSPSLNRVKQAAALGVVEYSIPAGKAYEYLATFPQRYGLRVTLWNVTTEQRLRYGVDLGSRYLTTDDVPGVLATLQNATARRPDDPRAALIATRTVGLTTRSAYTVKDATFYAGSKQYPRVIGTAVPTAALERLAGLRATIRITYGNGKGSLRIGGPNAPSADDVVLDMPVGSATFTRTLTPGDNGRLRVYTTSETAHVKIQITGWYTIRF